MYMSTFTRNKQRRIDYLTFSSCHVYYAAALTILKYISTGRIIYYYNVNDVARIISE